MTFASNARAPSSAAPAAVLFDLDGTLVDSERENVESVVLACRKLGAELSDEERKFVVGHSWNEIHQLLSQHHRLTVPMDTLIASAVDEKRALMVRTGHRALPMAVETVRRFAARCPLAIVSGASRVEVQDAIHGIRVAHHFQVVLGAEDYARGKPEPDPYLLAMDLLGLRAQAARCIVIEDAAPGIQAGRAAGARVIAVRVGNFVGYDLSAADVVVDTLAEVTDELCARLIG
jgi:beta-phosphoglucomutase-like phosphatase (HAD superfamily)